MVTWTSFSSLREVQTGPTIRDTACKSWHQHMSEWAETEWDV